MGEVVVGGQTQTAIIDTGSFDMVVLSAECRKCGRRSRLYNPRRSHSFEAGNLSAVQTYGSGATYSKECWETAEVGKFASTHQSFWSVYDASMSLLQDSRFSVIFGVGPPRGALLIAQREAENAGNPDDMLEIVEHVKQQTFFVREAGVSVLSHCLLPEQGAEGVFVWNDEHPDQRKQGSFQKVPVVGDMYWSAQLTDVRIGNVSLACVDEPCLAMLDSGTSLIAAPPDVVFQVNDMAWRLAPACEDLRKLPDLEFKLGGVKFTLPPNLYMGELEGEVREELRERMPHAVKNSECNPAMMNLEESDDKFGHLFILGLPFFRKYYTSLVFGQNAEPKDMYFAVADAKCEPSETLEVTRTLTPRHRPLKINGEKIRAPLRHMPHAKKRLDRSHSTAPWV